MVLMCSVFIKYLGSTIIYDLELYHCAVIFTATTLYIFTQILTDALCTIYPIMPPISAYNVECSV